MSIKGSKTNWKYILILVVFATIVSGAILAYHLMKKPEKGVEEETTNWEIYRNKGFNFELRYPQDWEVVEEIEEWETIPHYWHNTHKVLVFSLYAIKGPDT